MNGMAVSTTNGLLETEIVHIIFYVKQLLFVNTGVRGELLQRTR